MSLLWHHGRKVLACYLIFNTGKYLLHTDGNCKLFAEYWARFCHDESQHHSITKLQVLELCYHQTQPPAKTLQQVAQESVQTGFEYPQRRRIQNISWQLLPVLCHSQNKKLFSHVLMELPAFQFVLTAPCPVTVHH